MKSRKIKKNSHGRSQYVQVRVAPTEKEILSEAAKITGVTLSAWARERLLVLARFELGKTRYTGSLQDE